LAVPCDGAKALLQLRVFRLGFFEDRDVGVGIFPEREKILKSFLRLGSVALEGIRAGEAEMR
jgi:hypothetical protein